MPVISMFHGIVIASTPCEACMKTDLVQVTPLPDGCLKVALADGRHGVVDLRPWMDTPGMARLRDPGYFAQVTILLGAATWPDGEDIAPDTLASALQTMQPA
jgi:hypothetical protein